MCMLLSPSCPGTDEPYPQRRNADPDLEHGCVDTAGAGQGGTD